MNLRQLRNPKVIVSLVLLAALLALGFWPSATPVDLAPVARGTLRVTVEEEGETRVRHRFVVSAPVAGQVLRVTLEPGDAVRRGDTVLATLMPAAPIPLDARSRAEAEAAVAAAQAALGAAKADLQRAGATLDLARSELTRYRDLEREKIVPRQMLDAKTAEAETAAESRRAAEFAVAGAEYQLEMARARLLQGVGGRGPGRAITLKAPIDGVVLRRIQESEAVVSAGAPLLELGDPRELEIVSDLLSSDAVKVTPGAPVLVEQWGGDQPIKAKVRRVEPSGFLKISALGVEEQRVNVIIDFVDPPEARPALGDGYRVEVRIVLWEGESVLKVPASSLFRHGQDWAVYVFVASRAALRPVQIGRINGVEAEVRGGLDEGDLVVLHPGDALTDGSRVTRRTM